MNREEQICETCKENDNGFCDRIFGEYTVEMVDRKLSRRKDADLLREFDFIRFCLLAEIQERRQK